jgi:hypothetical protein
MKDIFYLLLYYPFINHVIELSFLHGMVIEIVINNEIQLFFPNHFYFFLNKEICVHY